MTRSAPARLSLLSVSSSAARAMIVMSGRSSRAVRVMKMFSGSESAQAISARARSRPAWRTHRVAGRIALDEADVHALGELSVLGLGGNDNVMRAGCAQVARDLR